MNKALSYLESTELKDIKKLCVICLDLEKPMIPIHQKIIKRASYSCSIYECLCNIFNKKVPLGDVCPSFICQPCLNSLKEAVNLKDTFLNSEIILLEYLKNYRINADAKIQQETQGVAIENHKNLTRTQVAKHETEITEASHSEKLEEYDAMKMEEHLKTHNEVKSINPSEIEPVNDISENDCTVKNCPIENNAKIKRKCLVETTENDENIKTLNGNSSCIESKSRVKTENDFKVEMKNYPSENSTKIKRECLVETAGNEQMDDSNIKTESKYVLEADYEVNIVSNVQKNFNHDSPPDFAENVNLQEINSSDEEEIIFQISCENDSDDLSRDEETEKKIKKQRSKKQTVHRCEICEKNFKTQGNLKRHTQAFHPEKEDFLLCQVCGFFAKSKHALYNHMHLRHQDKKYICNICGKQYFYKNNLKVHLQVHENKRQHLCTICGKGFNYSVALEYHMRVHTGEKKFKCTFCEKSFSMKCSLNRHLRTHTGARPYQCKYCDKSLRSKGELDCHTWTHTGYRPYHCVHCNKGFTKTNNLKLHMLGHKGPHECEICRRGFLEVNYLKMHMKLTHKMNE